jgi:hypothetical protein
MMSKEEMIRDVKASGKYYIVECSICREAYCSECADKNFACNECGNNICDHEDCMTGTVVNDDGNFCNKECYERYLLASK